MITELIKSQMFETVIMLASGAGLGALRELFLTLKELIPSRIQSACEILFWTGAAFYVTGFLKYASNGSLFFHNLLSLSFGVILWRSLFYDKIKYYDI